MSWKSRSSSPSSGLLTAFEFFITAGLGIYGFCIAPEAEKGFILAMMGVCALLQIPRTYLAFVRSSPTASRNTPPSSCWSASFILCW